MKRLCLLLLAAGPLFAQIEPYHKYSVDLDELIVGNTGNNNHGWTFVTEFTYEVVVVKDVKTLLWNVETCEYPPLFQLLTPQEAADRGAKPCDQVPENYALEKYSAVFSTLQQFYGQYPDGDDKYAPFSARRSKSAARPELMTTVSPVAPPKPTMVFLDGLGNSIFAVDMTTLNTVSEVVVPSTSGPFAIRPTITGPANEVWIANAGRQVTVVNLAAQTLLTNILTPSVPQASSPVGIVFDAQGKTGFEAIRYDSPDSSGNNGALLVFDAANRTVTSTLPQKYGPTALVMAPDGSTLYILDTRGTLAYYDVLSGTADLSVSTFTPGEAGGTFSGPIFIHPDGTRLFWLVDDAVSVFDLTKHKVTSHFSSGLPFTSEVTMTMSQDGARVYLSNRAGAIVIMETKYGNILTKRNSTGQSSLVIGGPPIAP